MSACPYLCSIIGLSDARSGTRSSRECRSGSAGCPACARRPGRRSSAAAAWGTCGCCARRVTGSSGARRSTSRRTTSGTVAIRRRVDPGTDLGAAGPVLPSPGDIPESPRWLARLGGPGTCRGAPTRLWCLTRCTASRGPQRSRSAGPRIRCGCSAHVARATWREHPRLMNSAPAAGDTREGMVRRARKPAAKP
jgi:hypothetical protein